MVAGVQEPLHAARSACAVVAALAGGIACAGGLCDSLASGAPGAIEIA